ncbi:MAG TPA: hypothetical protein VFQ53_13970 [Kofleriaceae bacterium]|nr:hypothetical protein [Kofleriaceae bacterium]
MPRSSSPPVLSCVRALVATLALVATARANPAATSSAPPAPTIPVLREDVATAPAPLGTATTVAPPAPRYPRSVIARPLTLPASLVALGADAGGNHDLSAITAAPIVGCGITDKLEVQVPYAFAVRELEARGSVIADAGYAIVRGALAGKLEAIARVRGGYDTLGSAATPLGLGVHLQYNVTPWLALISGAPGTQQLRISLVENAELQTPIDIGLPLGVGVQPTETLYLQLDTRLLQLALSESETLVIGRDVTPLALTAVWNVIPALDVQAAIGTDLSNEPGEALTFLVGARFYAGTL